MVFLVFIIFMLSDTISQITEVPPLGEEEDQLEYKTQHRFEDEPQVERISGDFTALNLMPIVTARISKATIESCE